MDRASRLEFCEKCTKREFSPQKGIICSLTKEQATFVGNCVEFHEDEKEAQIQENKKVITQKEKELDDSFGLSRIGIKNGIIAGIIVIIAAVLWFILGLLYFDVVFFFPPVLLVFGVLTLINGIKKDKKKKVNNNQILDSDF
jgi:hypothetical protein